MNSDEFRDKLLGAASAAEVIALINDEETQKLDM
jgi:mannitol/fructose-specific phosphotransferase system IIA component (Ntr-type)